MPEIDKAKISEALEVLRRGEKDWNCLDGGKRHGTVRQARVHLEEAIDES